MLDGLARDDLFTVVHDQVLTDTARFADVVLPATTHFESPDVGVPYGSFAVNRIAAVIDRVGESRTNDELSAGLAARLGFAAGPGQAFDPDPERLRSLALPGGVTTKVSTQAPGAAVQFRDVWPDTGGGRARLVASERAQAKGAARVPTYQRLDSDLPLTLVSPANARTINSIFGDTEGPSPLVHVHPDDAAARGLHDGQDVTVVGAVGVARHGRGRRRRPPSRRGVHAQGPLAPSRRRRVHRQRLRARHAQRPGRRRLLQRRAGRRPPSLTTLLARRVRRRDRCGRRRRRQSPGRCCARH